MAAPPNLILARRSCPDLSHGRTTHAPLDRLCSSARISGRLTVSGREFFAIRMPLLLKQALSVMRVLVVDDERNIRQTMGTAMESMDHEAVTGSTGEEGLRRMEAEAFQVVLLDLKLQQGIAMDL